MNRGNLFNRLLLSVFIFSCGGSAYAQAPSAPTSQDSAANSAKPDQPGGKDKNGEGSDGRTQKFGGMDFGVGLSLSIGRGGGVKSAEVVNGIVRVTQTDNARARLILETHYLLTPTGTINKGADFLGLAINTEKEQNWGFGPFVAFQPGTDQIIEAIGGGIMFGVRRPGSDGGSFNFGIGAMVDVNAKILGDGIIENQPLPAGEAAIRYKTRDQVSLLFITSFTF